MGQLLCGHVRNKDPVLQASKSKKKTKATDNQVPSVYGYKGLPIVDNAMHERTLCRYDTYFDKSTKAFVKRYVDGCVRCDKIKAKMNTTTTKNAVVVLERITSNNQGTKSENDQRVESLPVPIKPLVIKPVETQEVETVTIPQPIKQPERKSSVPTQTPPPHGTHNRSWSYKSYWHQERSRTDTYYSGLPDKYTNRIDNIHDVPDQFKAEYKPDTEKVIFNKSPDGSFDLIVEDLIDEIKIKKDDEKPRKAASLPTALVSEEGSERKKIARGSVKDPPMKPKRSKSLDIGKVSIRVATSQFLKVSSL